MSVLDQIRIPIKAEMAEFEDYFNKSLKTNVPLLRLITNYILRRKGKMIRPMLLFLSAKLNGTINDSTYVAATLIELLHTATLIHDDVVDESYERRGFFSINAIWKSKIAVLIGDYLLAKGLLISIDKKEFDLLTIVSDAVREMSEGELLQIQKSRRLNIKEEDYFEIIRKKTAALISSCTACGAKSVNASDEKIKLMSEFGTELGVAFQIRDDLFDYERSIKTGKPSGNDIKEKKLTLPLIYSLQNSSLFERKQITAIIRKRKIDNRSLHSIYEFVQNKGGIEYSKNIMNQHKEKARLILEENFPSNNVKKAMMELVDFSVQRKK